MDTKQHPIDVTDPQVQEACAAIMAAVLRRDPAELPEVWRLVAATATGWWAAEESGVSTSAPATR